MKITKASGEQEQFNSKKLERSLLRTGANPQTVRIAIEHVRKQMKPGMSTNKIFKLAQRELMKHHPKAGIRYSLKHALYELGPTGFPFEKYIAKVLEAYDYNVKTNQFIKGKCVSHEVDVVAEKQGDTFFIECKHHSNGGATSDLKVGLYTYARYLDLKNSLDYWKGEKHGWIFTNTRCTSECITYAECVGMRITAWHYPRNGGLEQLIEANELYPVTIFPKLSRDYKHRMIQNGVILAQDVVRRPKSLDKCRLPKKVKNEIIEQAKILLSNS